jgi:hypothetical protein
MNENYIKEKNLSESILSEICDIKNEKKNYNFEWLKEIKFLDVN